MKNIDLSHKADKLGLMITKFGNLYRIGTDSPTYMYVYDLRHVSLRA